VEGGDERRGFAFSSVSPEHTAGTPLSDHSRGGGAGGTSRQGQAQGEEGQEKEGQGLGLVGGGCSPASQSLNSATASGTPGVHKETRQLHRSRLGGSSGRGEGVGLEWRLQMAVGMGQGQGQG